MAEPRKNLPTSGIVFVYANLPAGQTFRLKNGQEVTIAGYPVSKLTDEAGNSLPAGQYGVTKLPAEVWSEIERVYGELTVMKSGLIFASTTPMDGEAIAEERKDLRHGLEPIDTNSTATEPIKSE